MGGGVARVVVGADPYGLLNGSFAFDRRVGFGWRDLHGLSKRRPLPNHKNRLTSTDRLGSVGGLFFHPIYGGTEIGAEAVAP